MIIGDGIILGAGGETASIFVTGLSETDTVTATKDGKTIIGKWTQKPNPVAHGLPDGYTELEYIESTGTQCFDTGIKASSKVGAEIDYFDFVTNGTSENILFSGSNGSWGAQLGMNNQMGYGKTYAYYGYDGNTGLPIETACKYKLENGVLYKNGQQVYSNNFSSFSYNYNIYLLAQNWAGTIRNHIKLKLKSFKMWESKILVRDFIPAKRNSDGSIGMYDLVTKSFFTNAGTGVFKAGAEIPHTIGGFMIDKIKDYGTWTVTATYGTKTATQDVLVDSANVFNVKIKFVDANTVLLLHAEDFTDSSLNNLTVTNTNVTISDNSKFGSKSFYFNGSNARLNITPTSMFEFGTGDFTVDMWIWPESQSNDHFFFSGSASGAFFFGVSGSKIGYGRASVAWDNAYSVSIPNSSWTHIALVRASNVVTIYVNGVSVGSATYTNTVTMGSGEVDIGSQGAGFYNKGCIDEVRVSNIARWTSNFTPPAEPY